MSNQFVKTLLILIFCLFGKESLAQGSVLAEGRWIKMSFEENGIYSIDFNTLSRMGFDVANINPNQIAIYSYPAGMLPQANEVDRPSHLKENNIWIEGGNDGSFDGDDLILFYVDSPHKVTYNSTSDEYEVERNLYSLNLNYFITIKNDNGRRLSTLLSISNQNPQIDWYREIVYHELDETNLLTSGREWFGERFTNGNALNFDIPIGTVKENQSLKIHVDAIAQSFSSSSLSIELNDETLGQLDFESIPNTQYGIKANQKISSFNSSSNIISGDEIELSISYDRNGQNNAVAYLNKFVIDVPTKLEFRDKALLVRNPEMAFNDVSNFKISNTNSSTRVWNITDPIEVKAQEFVSSSDVIEFGAPTRAAQEYIIYNPEHIRLVQDFEEVSNQNLKSLTTTEFFIITQDSFAQQAQRLADFRQSEDGIESTVVTTNQIYNEFSGGRQDVSAIRDFLRYHYKQGQVKYAMLFGKGSYDYLDRLEDNSNIVPTYESRNSIHPLLTYSSDDYFGFLEDNEGQWTENSSGDHSLDIGIGRIPATTEEQARIAVDKLIRYQSNSESFGDWRSNLLFIADDGDRNIHQRDADILASLVDTTYTQFKVQKLYLDLYEQVQSPTGEASSDAEAALTDAVNQGVLMINYTGHGAEFGWMQERILDFELMDEWTNPFKLPFLITATCEFGRNDDPDTFSGAENLLFKESGGAIGLLTTARPVFSSTNFRLNQALYGAVLEQNNSGYLRMGDIVQFTKNNSLQGSLNRNFILLGDPSMVLSYPRLNIEFNEINGRPLTENDTIRAFEKVRLSGHILEGGNIESNFNGTGTITVFDKSIELETRGDESDPFNYDSRDVELFKGEVSITNGQFSFEFVVPKNINYSFGKARISMYAYDESNDLDASGSLTDLILGGSGASPLDTSGPDIRAFLNDTISTSSEYDNEVQLILKFEDESGINISPLNFGQEIQATVNDSVTYLLSSDYKSEPDNFRKGIVNLNLENLSPGINSITIKAWDNVGNSNSTSLEFRVKENTSYISKINNHPNPFINETTFFVEHLLEGENVILEIDILDRKGAKVTELSQEYLRANSVLTLPWNGTSNRGQKLSNGIYIYSTKIRSKTSGISAIQRKKLIISN